MTNDSRELVYRRIEGEIENLITRGTLRPGDRVPSVREICRTRRVSPSSAIQALANLEARAMIRARPRSGFFVEARRVLAVPAAAPPEDPQPAVVGVSDDVARVFRDGVRPGILPLGAGLPDPVHLPIEELSRCVARAARTFPSDLGRYDMGGGEPTLRREIIKRLARRRCAIGPEEIVLTHGCMDAVNLALRAVARPGDLIAVESPTFFGIIETLASLQLRALPIPASCEDGIDLDALARGLARHDVKALVLVPTFGNPHGACLTSDRREKIAHLLARRKIPLIEDDLYGELAFDHPPPAPIKAGIHRDLTLYCGSFSKSVGPGLRLGWIAPGRFLERVLRLKTISSIAVSATLARAGADYLRSGVHDRHLRAFRNTLTRNLDRMASVVADTFPDGTSMSRPRGGYFLWVELPPGIDSLALRDRAISQDISICPGSVFSPTGRFRNFLRLNSSLAWRPEIERGLTVLGSLARDLQAKRGRRGKSAANRRPSPSSQP